MGATVTVNMRTVVHKGSGGVSTSLPDVCKTPAPPGPPVPIPYPNIARSSDTAKGSKKVKCDGNPIMLKNVSEFSRSTGDEAGTLKGVVSSKNMAQAKFALYSFDVKVEGKNVPRLGDPMTTNGNAPNAGHPAEVQSTVTAGMITLRCEDGWTDCQKRQMKAKAEKMDALAKEKGGLETRSTAGRIRDAADSWMAKFARDWNHPNPNRSTRWPPFSDPSTQDTHFFDDCAQTDDPKGNNMQADHVHEVQLGGHVTGPFLWLDAEVNRASGRKIQDEREKGMTKATGFTTENC